MLNNSEKKFLISLKTNRDKEISLLKAIQSRIFNWFVIFIILLLMSYCWNILGYWQVSYISLGLGIGVVLRDCGWLKKGNDIRKVMISVIDFKKVSELLSENKSSNFS